MNIVVPAEPGRVGCYVAANTASPYHSVNQVPFNLRPFIVEGDELDNERDDEPTSLTYTLNQQYAVGEDGRRGRSLQREVIRLEQAAAEQEYWEQRLAESNEQEQAALEIIQQDHELSIARDTAIATARARERDLSTEHAAAFVAEGGVDDADVSPTISEQTP